MSINIFSWIEIKIPDYKHLMKMQQHMCKILNIKEQQCNRSNMIYVNLKIYPIGEMR